MTMGAEKISQAMEAAPGMKEILALESMILIKNLAVAAVLGSKSLSQVKRLSQSNLYFGLIRTQALSILMVVGVIAQLKTTQLGVRNSQDFLPRTPVEDEMTMTQPSTGIKLFSQGEILIIFLESQEIVIDAANRDIWLRIAHCQILDHLDKDKKVLDQGPLTLEKLALNAIRKDIFQESALLKMILEVAIISTEDLISETNKNQEEVLLAIDKTEMLKFALNVVNLATLLENVLQSKPKIGSPIRDKEIMTVDLLEEDLQIERVAMVVGLSHHLQAGMIKQNQRRKKAVGPRRMKNGISQ